ncbi:hypothetical protein IV203_024418 [Nitzschia inconspicua]|uniref:Uncharacterized protein n=1 Tax=Nitzschia inconspicua TaxID=303405 RepID=A0A9K3KCU6_9STRA|nr:hypothetical protein IV203_024418 [Nitzschia inconspicua]
MCIYDVYGPCSCPHGRCFTVLAQCFAVGSWITSVLSVTSCFYIFLRPIPEEGEPELPREGFGYISRQVGVQEPPAYRQCAWYERDEKELFRGDGMWNAGKAMSLLAVGVGFVVMCLVLCTCCVAFELPTFDGLFWTCLLCFVAQALTFLSWGSDLCDEYECTWSSGTGMNITAAMMWVWAANMIKSFPEALPPRGSRNRNNNNKRRRRPNSRDDDDDAEDSPYLNRNNNKGGFQDEYLDEEGDDDDDNDEFNEWTDDDGNVEHQPSRYPRGYYDENGDWHDDDYEAEDDGQPQGYYDDDGNWYQQENADDDNIPTDDPHNGESSYEGSYFGEPGEDPFQPSSQYDDDDDDVPTPKVSTTSKPPKYKYSKKSQPEMSQEELEFLRESQRTMNAID